MSFHSESLSRFRVNQSLPFLLNAVCLSENQQIPISVFGLIRRMLVSMISRTRVEHSTLQRSWGCVYCVLHIHAYCVCVLYTHFYCIWSCLLCVRCFVYACLLCVMCIACTCLLCVIMAVGTGGALGAIAPPFPQKKKVWNSIIQ